MSKNTFYINSAANGGASNTEEEASALRGVLGILGLPTWDGPDAIRDAVRDDYKGQTATYRVTVEFEETV